MAHFIIRFLFCNLLICLAVGVLLGAKRLFRRCLTSHMQYHLWFLLLGILAVPFLPIRLSGFLPFFSWFEKMPAASASPAGSAAAQVGTINQAVSGNWMNDFTLSVARDASIAGTLLSVLWVLGILAMLLMIGRSRIQLHAVRKSALPLENRKIYQIYQNCLSEMKIRKAIPIYSAAFLTSPVMDGLFLPRVYVPLPLISDCRENELRYILLHELQHYRRRDALVNYLMAAAGVLYWFNPVVWFAFKQIRTDREIACDTSVLEIIGEDSRIDYGNTLINFAEKISFSPFQFSLGINGNAAQIRKRILNIAGYRPATVRRKLYGLLSCVLTAILLSGFLPALSSRAADTDRYHGRENGRNISDLDLSTYFGAYDGSFVLYEAASDSWQIYEKENASTRIPPASTYKIYSALFSLQSGVISREDSRIPWDGQDYAFDSWNADQTLESAMSDSVTWYFQEIDRRLGISAIDSFIQEIGYGNETVSSSASTYWYDSSLKISPIEQVEMLEKFYNNDFGFSSGNIETVKDSIRLFSGGNGVLYGKTGTLASEGRNVCGWFIGFIEREDAPLYFAVNIQDEDSAAGAAAAELAFSVLSDMGIWDQDR